MRPPGDRVIFFNTGWMREYCGADNDGIKGGGKFVEEHGYGHEMFNFLEEEGWCYGFVQSNSRRGGVTLRRLGGAQGDEALDGITVIWTATHPDGGGRRVVGWYDNATVYARLQEPQPDSVRSYQGSLVEYVARAQANDVTLLPPALRSLVVPSGKGYIGRNVWYADSPNAAAVVSKVRAFIANYKTSATSVDSEARGFLAGRPDLQKRLMVEKRAIDFVKKWCEDNQYAIHDVQKDNLGWDLEARKGGELLRIEVKGSSMKSAVVEITPHEWRAMNKHVTTFRLCIVEDALSSKPSLRIFRRDRKLGAWVDEEDGLLDVQILESARARGLPLA